VLLDPLLEQQLLQGCKLACEQQQKPDSTQL
jgi:hypothetical protein